MKLVQNILRPLNRACHQLRIEHYIQCINTKMPFCFLIATVHFNGVTHSLESVK